MSYKSGKPRVKSSTDAKPRYVYLEQSDVVNISVNGVLTESVKLEDIVALTGKLRLPINVRLSVEEQNKLTNDRLQESERRNKEMEQRNRELEADLNAMRSRLAAPDLTKVNSKTWAEQSSESKKSICTKTACLIKNESASTNNV